MYRHVLSIQASSTKKIYSNLVDTDESLRCQTIVDAQIAATMVKRMMTTIARMRQLRLAHGWRPPRGGKRAQRDTAPKLIVIDLAEILNWGRCR